MRKQSGLPMGLGLGGELSSVMATWCQPPALPCQLSPHLWAGPQPTRWGQFPRAGLGAPSAKPDSLAGKLTNRKEIGIAVRAAPLAASPRSPRLESLRSHLTDQKGRCHPSSKEQSRLLPEGATVATAAELWCLRGRGTPPTRSPPTPEQGQGGPQVVPRIPLMWQLLQEGP